MINVNEIGKAAKDASYKLALKTSAQKDAALEIIANELKNSDDLITQANQKDLQAGEKAGLSPAMLDRLKFDTARINLSAQAIFDVIKLKDPVGETIEDWKLYNGIAAQKIRVPFGVIAIIFEARPNVAIDAAALCLKTGNAVILKGSASALNSNICIVEVIQKGLSKAGLPPEAVQIIADPERGSIDAVLRMNNFIDLVIPRGGSGLIKYVVENSSVPVIETGAGNCHVYFDNSADLKMAKDIILNAKVQRPSVCNAAETLLWHKALSDSFILEVLTALQDAAVEIRACDATRKIAGNTKAATEEDWSTEFLDYILAVKRVSGLDEAVSHINRYGTRHSEAIVTANKLSAQRFMAEVDAAAVYWNASTRFTDGGEFGFGAEIGISTQKLHARGPMGLRELTSYKYLLCGSGQVRG